MWGLSFHGGDDGPQNRIGFSRFYGRGEGGRLFERELTDKLHDAIFDDIGFNADP
jgi:hypothetical protein